MVCPLNWWTLERQLQLRFEQIVVDRRAFLVAQGIIDLHFCPDVKEVVQPKIIISAVDLAFCGIGIVPIISEYSLQVTREDEIADLAIPALMQGGDGARLQISGAVLAVDVFAF